MSYILFDCDGNVIDSEIIAMKIACDGLVAVAAKQGVSVPEALVLSMFGKTIPDMIRILGENYGVRFPDSIEKDLHQETVRALSVQTQPVAGIGAFLEKAKSKGHVPVIVTSSGMDRVVAGLKCAGLKSFFPNHLIFSATSHLLPGFSKPHPAIYFRAMRALKINPLRTFTTEDSASGVKAAVAANIVCFGNLAGLHISDKQAHEKKLREAGVSGTFSSWLDMIPLIDQTQTAMRKDGWFAAVRPGHAASKLG